MEYTPAGRLKKKGRVPLRKLAQCASIAAGVQFGWALQLSLLTPYVQELGIPHAWASLIWLCGPISGMIVQPIVGHYSDNCTSIYGRRRPFIVVGAVLVSVGVLIIGFSADIGYLLGDRASFKPWAIGVFILGFWVLDLANNTLQGPCRALLADFTGRDSKRTRRANSYFSAFMAIGNVLGFATGSYGGWYKIFGFTLTAGCDIACANLKTAFLLGIFLLALTTFASVTAAKEKQWVPEGQLPTSTTPLLDRADPPPAPKKEGCIDENEVSAPEPEPEEGGGGGEETDEDNDSDEEEEEEEETKWVLWELLGALRELPSTMWFVLLVTAFTWLAWFPFLLFDTDWMGREVYRGAAEGSIREVGQYYSGVHTGALGLMFNSLVLGLASLAVEPLCQRLGSRVVWAVSNFILAACLLATYFVGSWTGRMVGEPPAPPLAVYCGAIAIFAILGIPLAVTYSVPYSLTATYTSQKGGGQGLSMGVLNLAVVLPQVVVSIASGPWDALFGGGNVPAFMAAAVFAALGGAAALIVLPKLPPNPLQGRRPKLQRTMSSPCP